MNEFVNHGTTESLASLTNLSNMLKECSLEAKKAKEELGVKTSSSFIPRYGAKKDEDNNLPSFKIIVSAMRSWRERNISKLRDRDAKRSILAGGVAEA